MQFEDSAVFQQTKETPFLNYAKTGKAFGMAMTWSPEKNCGLQPRSEVHVRKPT